jgi:hypothetical protein
MILDQSRGLRVGEWWIKIVDLHYRLLVMDETGMITTTIVVTTAVNESENGIKKEIGIGGLLPRVGRLLRLHLLLLVGRDRGTDLQSRIINRDEMRPCMRDEMKRYVEEGVGIGVE